MYLHSLKLKNFKGFRGESEEIYFHGPNGDPGSGLNILVGENNAGKSTLMQALCYLRDSGTVSGNLTTIDADGAPVSDECAVIGEFADSSAAALCKTLDAFINGKNTDAVKAALTASGHLRARRSLWDPKKTLLLRENDGFAEAGTNPTGIDVALKSIIDLHALWADDDAQKLASYGANTLCQKLLNDIFKSAQASDDYQKLKDAFDVCFSGEDSSLRKGIREIEEQVSQQFRLFFGAGSLRFDFSEPAMETLVKTLTPMLDLDYSLPLAEHGQGVQRLAVLALLVSWASFQANRKDEGSSKPYIFLLDEPEICLHPRGQAKLLEALLTISKDFQVFVSTHSPIFLHSPAVRSANLLLCRKDASSRSNVVISRKGFGSLLPHSPTWGEICWFAYNMPTIEFHDELYSLLQEATGKHAVSAVDQLIRDAFAEMHEACVLYPWTRTDKKGNPQEDRTLSYCVRNAIHHPDSPFIKRDFVETHLESSIKEMLRVVEHVRANRVQAH